MEVSSVTLIASAPNQMCAAEYRSLTFFNPLNNFFLVKSEIVTPTLPFLLFENA